MTTELHSGDDLIPTTNMDSSDDARSHFPTDDTTVLMSDEAGPVSIPPARLADRLYRRSLARRKSSNTSSRRNSMTSSHSHHSHGSSSRPYHHRTASHGTYVAQHLRRASIIESRKARLADRAAHVEQVRMRAALAKAVPRASITSSEERALAAAVAREKYLAKVVAACAEEVQKAKQRALDTKARKAEDEKKARQEMEDRFAEADKRRAEYQRCLHARRSRRASSPARKLAPVVEDPADLDTCVEEDPVIDEETAAMRIQRTWRLMRRRAAVDAYLELDFSLDSIKTKSFDHLTAILASPPLIASITSILTVLGFFQLNEKANARIFLSAYAICSHPDAVLSKHGEQEEDLVDKAREVVVVFESAVSRFALWNRYMPSMRVLREQNEAWSAYSTSFDAWKDHDATALLETMLATFIEFDAIRYAVKDDTRGHAADDFNSAIRDQQAMLLSRMRKLAGPERAGTMIKNAIREARGRVRRRRAPAEERPRAATAPPTVATENGDVTAVDLDQAVPEGPDSLQRPMFLAKFSPIPSNRELAHELSISKDYRIESLSAQYSLDVVNRQLCHSMKRGMADGQGMLWTTSMAECIRGRLLHVLGANHPLHAVVSNVLDSDHVYMQCNQGVFSYDKFFAFMASILPQMCAPYRDKQMKELAATLQAQTDEDGMFAKLFDLLHAIDQLSLDNANFLLMQMAPLLIREAAGYEHRTFERALAAGEHTLAKTMQWWRHAREEMVTQADQRDPEHVRLAASRPTNQAIYSRALCSLVVSSSLSVDDWPETLALDKTRLTRMRRETLRMTCIGATLLTAKNLLKRDVRSAWKIEANRLMDLMIKHDAEDEDNDDDPRPVKLAQKSFAVIESAHNLPPATATTLQSACMRFYTQTSSGRLSDPVLRLVFQRLRTHVLDRVSAISSQERVRGVSTAGDSLARAGLPEFVTQIADVVKVLCRVKEVDWEAHGVWYERIASEADADL